MQTSSSSYVGVFDQVQRILFNEKVHRSKKVLLEHLVWLVDLVGVSIIVPFHLKFAHIELRYFSVIPDLRQLALLKLREPLLVSLVFLADQVELLKWNSSAFFEVNWRTQKGFRYNVLKISTVTRKDLLTNWCLGLSLLSENWLLLSRNGCFLRKGSNRALAWDFCSGADDGGYRALWVVGRGAEPFCCIERSANSFLFVHRQWHFEGTQGTTLFGKSMGCAF